MARLVAGATRSRMTTLPSEEPSLLKTVSRVVFCFAIGHPLGPGVGDHASPRTWLPEMGLRKYKACHSFAGVIMDTEKSDSENTEAAEQPRKPIVDQMTDLAAQGAGTLAETAVKAVAKRAKKAVAKRIPPPVKKAAKAVAQAAKTPQKRAKKAAKKRVKATKAVSKTAKRSSKKATKKRSKKAGRKPRR
jgi:hypothetical protein